MGKGNKKLTETEIKKNKEKRKLAMRRWREAMKNDPDKYEEAKRKERQRYHERAKTGKIKKINDLNLREQRSVRKKWRKYSKKYYDSKKALKDSLKFLETTTPPDSPQSIRASTPPLHHNLEEIPSTSSNRTAAGRKMRRRNANKYKLKIKKLEEQLKKEKRRGDKYKKRAQRKSTPMATPEKNVRSIIGNQKVTDEVKKKLLVGEVITSQIKKNLQGTENNFEKAKFVTKLSGKIVKKYKCMHYIGDLTSSRKIYTSYKTKQFTKNELLSRFKVYITKFLEKDENSRMCPGKKDTITFKKCKKQKRYLNDSLINLHKKFLSGHPNLRISYASFCKLRPFWILIANTKYRETCLCSMHANMSLITRKLKQLNVISESSVNHLIRNLCCESEVPKEICLERKCPECKNKKINSTEEFDRTEVAFYDKWISKKVTVTIKGEEKSCQKTIKEKVQTTKGEMLLALENSMDSFLVHIRNIQHQYHAIDTIKNELKNDEIIFHMDFSENYNCKYGEEVQSAHFGGSKPQISLHTVVIYYRDEMSVVKPLSCCTFCDDLRHDPAAICAHLKPLIEDVKILVPNIRHANFLSDGPCTQYRNKKMFYLMVEYIAKKLGVQTFRWHFSEKGHGKGAPDGIGGCLKRTADALVARGKDIPNLETLVEELKENIKNIKIYTIKGQEMRDIDNIIPQVLTVFKGTMKIHEITWTSQKPFRIQARELTCLQCDPGETCTHYGLGTIEVSKPSPLQLLEMKLEKDGDIEDEILSSEPNDTLITRGHLTEGVYVLVQLQGKKVMQFYIAHIESIEGENEFGVKFMRKGVGEKFVFPTQDDKATIELEDVIQVLGQPKISRDRYCFPNDFSKFNMF